MRRMVFIMARLVENPEAYRSVTNTDVEEGLMEEVQGLPYVAKVTVLDMEE